MSYEITIRQVERVHTAIICGRVGGDELSRFVPAACGEVWSFVRNAGLAGPGRNLALYRADGSVEAGVEMAGVIAGSDRVRSSALPAGRVAHTVHHGPYGGLSKAHAAVRNHCAERGLELTGDSWELYGHWQQNWNEEPSRIVTEVVWLLDV